jgi:hypothetical protein
VKAKPPKPKLGGTSAKRKLVGPENHGTTAKEGDTKGLKKMKKAAKGMLSFDEAEGEV